MRSRCEAADGDAAGRPVQRAGGPASRRAVPCSRPAGGGGGAGGDADIVGLAEPARPGRRAPP